MYVSFSCKNSTSYHFKVRPGSGSALVWFTGSGEALRQKAGSGSTKNHNCNIDQTKTEPWPLYENFLPHYFKTQVSVASKFNPFFHFSRKLVCTVQCCGSESSNSSESGSGSRVLMTKTWRKKYGTAGSLEQNLPFLELEQKLQLTYPYLGLLKGSG